MHEQEPDHWNPLFIQTTPLFWPITPAYQQLPTTDNAWPTHEDYNQFISNSDNSIKNKNNQKISFVAQGAHCDTFEDEYEPRIYCTGEVQTRLNNWHDFFQVMVWKTFPKTKSLLNKIHYDAATERHKNKIKQRGKLENFVTLFDECGTVVLSSDEKALEMVKDFQWDNFFVKNKAQFGKTIDCTVFGHAMYEKALKPYIGMTSHCLLLHVKPEYFKLTTQEKTDYIDDALSNNISEIENLNTKILTPLPILGVPQWYEGQSDAFYANQSYFRTGRNRK